MCVICEFKGRKPPMQTIPGDTRNSPFESDGTYFKVANVVELEERPFKVVTVEDRHILLLLADGHIRALDSRCPHMGILCRRER